MAVVGLSKPYYSEYTYSAGTVSYGTPATISKAVTVGITLDNAEPTVLYADNGPAESVSSFAGGTLTLTTDDLPISLLAALLGLTTDSVVSPAGTSLDFPSDLTAPYMGFGCVVKRIYGGTAYYDAIVLTKVQFQIPEIAANTQGETIEFQTPSITATILRDDTADGNWLKRGQFASEADAVAWISSTIG